MKQVAVQQCPLLNVGYAVRTMGWKARTADRRVGSVHHAPAHPAMAGCSLRPWWALPGLHCLLVFAVLAWPLWVGAAAMELRQFDDPAKQARYEALIKELRCLVCQNQALSDSDADLAQDLRDEVYRIIQSGKTDQEAVAFLVDRYGDFVLYRPPLNALTWLLWGGPLLLGLAGGGVVWRQWQRHRNTSTPRLSEADAQRLQQLRALADQPDDHS